MAHKIGRLTGVAAPLFALVAAVLLAPVGNTFHDWLKTKGFNNPWILGVLFAIAALGTSSLKLRAARRERFGQNAAPPLFQRRRLIDRVLEEHIEVQLESGLYALAPKEFRLAERALRGGTHADRPLNQSIQERYQRITGPLVILGEPGTGRECPVDRRK